MKPEQTRPFRARLDQEEAGQRGPDQVMPGQSGRAGPDYSGQTRQKQLDQTEWAKLVTLT